MDHPSDSTLDELAGLFLTEPTKPVAPVAPVAHNTASARVDPLSGPAPIKLSPKVTPAVGPAAPPHRGAPVAQAPRFGPTASNPPHDQTDDQLLELLTSAATLGTAPEPDPPAHRDLNDSHQRADQNARQTANQNVNQADIDAPSPALRWTGHDEIDLTNPPRRAQPAQAVAEAVLLGNLPGMAGPWLTQYAQLLAQHQGGRRSVAVLHLDGDRLDLELIEPTVRHTDDDPATRAPGLRVPPGGYANRDLIDLLDQLCRTGPTPVGTVLLHADPHHEQAERLVDFADWTLVSGADEAALAAAGQLMRSLLDQDPRVAATRLGLMVVGSDADASQHAAQRLSRDLAPQLDTAPQLVGYQQQMIPARCRILGSFEGIDAQWPQLTAWLAALQPPTSLLTEPATQEEPATAPAPADPTAPASMSASMSEPMSEPMSAPRPAARATLPPLSAPVQVPAHGHPLDTEPDLFALIDTHARTHASIPGGVALEARCPSAPDAQLALDAAGRLHLLLRHDSDAGDLPTPREAIVELVAVRTWARQHRQLLQLTERSRRLDLDADPVLHLFTDRADLSVELISRLGGLLKLHLLRDVAVGSEHTWFCVPLSA